MFPPLDKNGGKRFHFKIIKDLGRFVTENPWIVETKPVYDLGVGYYHPHARLCKFNNKMGINSIELGRGGMVGSFIDTLGVCNINFKMINLEEDPLDDKFVPNGKLAVIGQEYMDGRIQQKLLDFAERGGHLILLKQIPDKNEDFNDCTYLRDALNISKVDVIKKGKPYFDVTRARYKGYDYCIYSDINTYEFSDGQAEHDIMSVLGPKVCGFTRRTGKGKISVIGYIPQIFMDVSRKFARDYFGKDSRDGILIYERRNKEESLFTVLNMHDETEQVEIGGKVFSVPPRKGSFIIKRENEYSIWE